MGVSRWVLEVYPSSTLLPTPASSSRPRPQVVGGRDVLRTPSGPVRRPLSVSWDDRTPVTDRGSSGTVRCQWVAPGSHTVLGGEGEPERESFVRHTTAHTRIERVVTEVKAQTLSWEPQFVQDQVQREFYV